MSLEANKIAAAVLVGGMLTLSVGLVSNIIYGSPAGAGAEHVAAEGGVEAAATESAAAAATPAAAPVSSVPMIAAADVAAGEKAAGKCKTCHTFEKGGPNRVGPNLWNVVGGKSAHAEGFAYSEVIANLNITWDYDHLDQFLANPKAYAKGTKMSFAGLKKPEERAALIRWLRDQADAPIALPQ
ncbi:cytochrome c family protein [Dongia mobilis]|jgi:cytochrome c|uniref:c-type cytochrome n=1 Tax=Dongia sp. TaxID=1977262 RepID=UPI0026F1A615